MDVLSFHLYTDGRPGDVLDTPTGVYIDGLRSLMRSMDGSNKTGMGIWKAVSWPQVQVIKISCKLFPVTQSR